MSTTYVIVFVEINLFYSILFYSILFYSILFYSILCGGSSLNYALAGVCLLRGGNGRVM